MKIIRSARLSFREGTSDKLYEVDLVENDALQADARFLVNFRYGRRGRALREGTKTSAPLAGEAAERVFDSVVVSKVNEGYRRIDAGADLAPAATADPDPTELDGRHRELLARLEACLRSPWPMKDRDRLFWRIGEVRMGAATEALVAMVAKLGPKEVSYSLVFALARAGGEQAAPTLQVIAAEAGSALVRDLARFALASRLMGAARQLARLDPSLPNGVARAAEARDADRLTGAFSDLAGREPVAVGPALVALARAAQDDDALRAALAAAIRRMPARPPYLIGLRKVYKYAEMADDAVLFAATAHRFETAQPMHRAARDWERGRVFVRELGTYVQLDQGRRGADATVGLSVATFRYFKRRIWRTLRKRGELADPTFVALAAAYLLSLRPADLDKRTTWTHFVYQAAGQWSREPRASGPLARNWTASQLLFREARRAKARYGSLTFVELPAVGGSERGEAFPELWRARPDLALRLAAESLCEPVVLLGVDVLKASPDFVRELASTELGRLLASPHAAVLQLAFAEARDRLARGVGDDDLLAALIGSDLVEARRLTVERIERDGALPWSGPSLAFATLTAVHDDLAEPISRWARERSLGPGVAEPLAQRIADWLLAASASLTDTAAEPGHAGTLSPVGRGQGEGVARSAANSLPLTRSAAPTRPLPTGERVSPPSSAEAIRLVRARMRLLWPNRDMPLSPEVVRRLMEHPAPAVAAAGIDALGLTGTDPATLSDETWRSLLGSPSEEVQEAALTLFGGLADAELTQHAALVVAFATAPSSGLRQAARPLVARIAARDLALAEKLARDLIDSLFLSAPDEAYPADIVALLQEALPEQLAALDAGTVWRLLQARAKGAQLLGTTLLEPHPFATFSVRQTARLGNHPHLAARRWAMDAYEAGPQRFQAEAADAVLLVESQWPETVEFARRHFATWPAEAWTPETLAVVTDSTKQDVLDFARTLLRSRLAPADAEAQLTRLLEHPAQTMHLLVTEMLTEEAATSEAAFDRLLPLARIVMLQVQRGRVAKDRMAAFLKAEALRSSERAARIAPLFSDLTLSGTERDRAQAVLALRDIGDAHPGIAMPIARRQAPTRRGERAA